MEPITVSLEGCLIKLGNFRLEDGRVYINGEEIFCRSFTLSVDAESAAIIDLRFYPHDPANDGAPV